MSSIVMLFLTLLLSSFEASLSVSIGSRSILRSINNNGGERPDFAVDLNATNFDAVLRETPASYAVVEFFAHWSPACRNYKPQYEKVARLFNGADAVHPGIILMMRVDCALKINTNLCNKFSVARYPMLFWSPPSKFIAGGWDPKQDKSEIRPINDGRTADRLLNWINKQMGTSYSLEDEKYENDHIQANVSDPRQIARAVNDVEEATSAAFDIILQHKMIKLETRASLIKFLQLLVVHHPSRSCGLWVLLHSLSVRIDDGESHMAFGAVCDFIHDFFVCAECRQHFYEMCSSVSSPFNKTRDFSLWLWSAHNKVNERLMKDEASLETSDPKFPKIIWPPRQLCPSCYLAHIQIKDGNDQIDWDHDEVFKFLTSYYGKILVTLYKDTVLLAESGADKALAAEELAVSTSAVVVPVGAAVAISVASCAFGALACFWRSHQKSREVFSPPTLFKEHMIFRMVMSSFEVDSRAKLFLKKERR